MSHQTHRENPAQSPLFAHPTQCDSGRIVSADSANWAGDFAGELNASGNVSDNVKASRRGFLASAIIGGMCGAGGLLPGGVSDAGAAGAGETRLSISHNNDLFRVRMQMEVKGNVTLVEDPLLPDGKKKLLPVTADLNLDYEERFLRPAGATPESEVVAVERHIHDAVEKSRLSRTAQTTELRGTVTDVIARREQLPETIYSNDEYLTHKEIDLLRTPISSVAIDRLVPQQMMRPGEKVAITKNDLASFFNLSGVASSDVEIELVSADSSQAKLQMRGKIEGSVSGVPTRLQIVGKLTLDRRAGAVAWAAVAIHETREIGKAEPGFDITATVRMVRKPLAKVQTLPAKPAEIVFDEPPPTDRLLVAVASRHVGLEGLMDRRWRMMQDVPGDAVLRMIENDQAIAQLNLRPLPRLPEGQQWTLAAFENDVRKTLGKRFGELIESHEGMTDGGLRLLRVVAGGRVKGVPIQWIMMHISDNERRRVLATWTMDGDSVPRLAGSDIQLAASLRLLDGVNQTAQNDSKAMKTGENTDLSVVDSLDEVESVASTADVVSPSDVKRR
ncbi:hypothetical protein FHS27_001132 [Rhodopirellula rubra]|uniref:Uncharacterized protein n=1 Tax=Aporhodopirellula rubra TaxID=980271 RepID=A0A7W5DW93_9BACT|nr:hypothetical protein [Aporhodopirellula rubra]MBB3205332.1 hypothetical protein [Aporhodopirellula rubra]